MPVVGTFLTYKFIRELTRPWDEMKAYDLGIIDDEGNLLKTSKDLKTQEEKESYTLFHRLVWNIKRILEKLPGGASKIKSYAAAAWMLKEHREEIEKELIHLVEFDEVSEAKVFLHEVTKVAKPEEKKEMVDISNEVVDLHELSSFFGINEEIDPTNVEAAVAKKDMPLCKKKKKKSSKEDDMSGQNDCSVKMLKRKIAKANDITEGREIKRVVRKGKVRKKLSCPPGQINKGGKCVTSTSKDKQRFIKAAKKRKKKMAGKSRAGANRLRAKSVRKRSSSGLK